MRCALYRFGRTGILDNLVVWGILAVLLLSGIAAGCRDNTNDQPHDVVKIPANAPDDESWNTTIIFTDSLGMKARLRFGHARRYLAKMETILDSGVYIEFFDHDGSLNATLIADSARIDDRTKDMAAFGRVHVQSQRNRTEVDTERLRWISATRRLKSDAHVRIVNHERQETIEGSGFESDDALKNYTIYKVTGRMQGAG